MDDQHTSMQRPETQLAEPVETFGVAAPDRRVERALGAATLRAAAEDILRGGDATTSRSEIASWLRQRADVIRHGQWSI